MKTKENNSVGPIYKTMGVLFLGGLVGSIIEVIIKNEINQIDFRNLIISALVIALLYTMYLITNRDNSNDQNNEDLKILNSVGFSQAYIKLKGSIAEPVSIINRAEGEIKFFGGQASKWLEDGTFNLLESKVKNQRIKFKFLLFNPDSPKSQAFQKLRGSQAKPSWNHIQKLVALGEKYSNFEIRVYDSLPIFRMSFVDKELFVRLYDDHHKKYKFGWENVVVRFKNNLDIEVNYYHAFLDLFNQYWEDASIPHNSNEATLK